MIMLRGRSLDIQGGGMFFLEKNILHAFRSEKNILHVFGSEKNILHPDAMKTNILHPDANENKYPASHTILILFNYNVPLLPYLELSF